MKARCPRLQLRGQPVQAQLSISCSITVPLQAASDPRAQHVEDGHCGALLRRECTYHSPCLESVLVRSWCTQVWTASFAGIEHSATISEYPIVNG